jgi:hypothetical protein
MPATWQVKTVLPGYAYNKHIYFALFAFISVHLRISIFLKMSRACSRQKHAGMTAPAGVVFK